MERLIRRLAAASSIPPAKAADEIDRILHDLVIRLRRGEPARLPGLGSFLPGTEPHFEPETQHEKRRTTNRRTSRTDR
jgi:nucleoid DNA-binding protein